MNMDSMRRSSAQNRVINTFRDLWRQFFHWHVTYIVNLACDFGSSPYVTRRIEQLARNIASAFGEFYGYQNAKILELMLINNFNIAARLFDQIKRGRAEAVESERAEWYMFTDEVAQFLASLNPYWTVDEWREILYDRVAEIEEFMSVCPYTSIEEAGPEVEARIEELTRRFSDYMSEGIIKQFNIR